MPPDSSSPTASSQGASTFFRARGGSGAAAAGENTFAAQDITLAPSVARPDSNLERSLLTTSSCGLCGNASIEAVRTKPAFSVADDRMRVDKDPLPLHGIVLMVSSLASFELVQKAMMAGVALLAAQRQQF